MHKGVFAIAGAFALSACQQGEQPSAPPSYTDALAAGEPAAGQPPAPGDETSDASTQGLGRSVEIENDLVDFNYAYPDKAGAIAPLKAMLDTELEEAREQTLASARDDREQAETGGYPFRPHGFGTQWKVVTDLPRWLSLSADTYEYTGGAHGMSAFNTLLWDREAATAREPMDLFTSRSALRDAIRARFCDALDKEREKRRGTPVDRDSGRTFSECIDPTASTVILGSSNGRTFDRLGILIAPYEAGPYAEGTYEVTLPVNDAVREVTKPQFRSSFSSSR